MNGSLTDIILIALLVVLILICVFFNSQLKHKKDAIQKKNDEIRAGEEELRQLKLILEEKAVEVVTVKNDILQQQESIAAEKLKVEEKNKKIWKMSESALKEKHRLEEMTAEMQLEKEKLEAEKKKLDEKVKKLWQTSITIHKEKERVSELNELLETEKAKTELLLAELQVKNNEITDNINYAQRIQSAILPNIDFIYANLRQTFIMYIPKDIVSGDFYAFAKKNNRSIMVTGDCTGHGVSGAFMSMIASSLLNQVINERNIEEPALILSQLNTLVIETLRQSENESNDGMDVAICSFDSELKSLQFAGANRPLWIVRDKAHEIEVIKPDKFPIGGLQMARERKFTNYEVPLGIGDTVYLFTDGYADQFGGANGKKLMTAKFKEALLHIRHLGMKEQEAYLRKYFFEWKQDHEQVDDVLVIGVRV